MTDRYLKDIQRDYPEATAWNIADNGHLIVTMSRLASIRDVWVGNRRYTLCAVDPGVSPKHRGELFCRFWPVTIIREED